MEELISKRGNLGKQSASGGGKRSVHTKFELSEEALEAHEALGALWQIPEKEVADMATQLTSSFLSEEDEETRRLFVEKAREQPGSLTRDTYVLSRETKSFLEAFAGDLDLTRDQFFDACLRLAHSVIQFLREAQIDRHDALLSELRELLGQAESIEATLQEKATDVDPLKPAIIAVREQIEAIVDDIETEVEQGRPLDQNHEFT